MLQCDVIYIAQIRESPAYVGRTDLFTINLNIPRIAPIVYKKAQRTDEIISRVLVSAMVEGGYDDYKNDMIYGEQLYMGCQR